MYSHLHFNIPKCHRLSSHIAYSPTNLNRLTGSTKRNQTLEIPCHEYRKFNKNITKWTLMIGQDDSCSWFCLFLYNRLTPTVYNLTVWHWHSKITIVEQTKHLSQLTDLTYLPPPCCPVALSFVIYKTKFYHESSQFFFLFFFSLLFTFQ